MIEDELSTAAELHAGKRRWLRAIGGNVLLLVLMLGVPWLRGYLRTRALWRAFGTFGACLYGGKVAEAPGLGMPPGHEARFATRALRDPSWAAACDDELAALAPEEAIFIMPGLKGAENDLRGAVELVRTEFAPLPARAPGTRLSSRPLQAIERLRAALANHASAAGAGAAPEREAFVLARAGESELVPTPTRLPLYAGANARLALWGSERELYALATDSTGVSCVEVRGGGFEQTRASRNKLLDGAIPSEHPGSFVWAMPRARCAERAGGCADKTMGIASVPWPVRELPAPRWLGAHPSGRSDRAVLRFGERIVVAAQSARATTEVREFQLTREDEARATNEPPLAPARVWAEGASGQALALAPGGEPAVLIAGSSEQGARLSELTPEGVHLLAELPGAVEARASAGERSDVEARAGAGERSHGDAWVVGCTEADRLRMAFGHEHALVLGERMAGNPPPPLTTWPSVELELAQVVDEQNGARDRVVPVCGGGDRALALVQDRRNRLQLVVCRAGEPSCSVETVAQGVRSFAALAWGEQLIVAYAGEGELSQIRARSLPLAAPDRGEEQVPAACWSDGRGLCGAPVLARAGARALLGAREGTDLRVLESRDGGLTWHSLRDLAKRD